MKILHIVLAKFRGEWVYIQNLNQNCLKVVGLLSRGAYIQAFTVYKFQDSSKIFTRVKSVHKQLNQMHQHFSTLLESVKKIMLSFIFYE